MILLSFLCLVSVSSVSAETDVCLLFSDLSDSFASQIRLCLENTFSEDEFTLHVMDAHGSIWTQTDQVQNTAASGADIVCIQTCEYASTGAALQLLLPLEEAGIPVIFFGRGIAPSNEALMHFLSEHPRVLYVHHDPDDIGRTLGLEIGSYLRDHYARCDLNGDGQISYIAFQGDPYDPDANQRTSLALEVANRTLEGAGHPPLFWYDGSGQKALADPLCMWSADFACTVLSEVLSVCGPTSGNMPELVICGNDDMANGSINALFHYDYNTDLPDSPAVPVFGVDGTLLAKTLIQKGRMTGTVMRSPEHLARGILSAVSHCLDGTPLDPSVGRVEGPCLFPSYGYTGNP